MDTDVAAAIPPDKTPVSAGEQARRELERVNAELAVALRAASATGMIRNRATAGRILRAKELEVEQAHLRISKLELQVAELRVGIAELDRVLQATQRSVSWRITRPLRALKAKLRPADRTRA